MNRILMTGAGLVTLCAALSACATTPAYPTDSGPAASSRAQPAAAPGASTAQATQNAQAGQSAQAAQAPQPSPQTPAQTSASAATPAPSPAPVQSSSLPPVEGAPPPAASPPAAAPPPPPSEAPPPPATRAMAAPPPVYRPPEVKRLATGEVVHPKGMYRLYVVAPHDDLYAIARDLEATPDEIIKANHLKHPGQLTVGQRLKIPVSKAYVARSGDTLRVIAKRFSVSVADLSDLNDLSERAHLHPGDQIALPANIHDRGPVTEEAEAPRARYGGGYTPRGGIVANGEPYTPSPYALEAARERAAASASASASGGAPAAASTAPETSSLSDAEVSALAKGRFIWPVQGALANHFGVTGLGERNDGVDIAAPLGAAVRAAAAGDVVYAGNQIPGFGNLVLIEHADGWVTAYAHLQHMSVHMRQFVSQGEEIGTVGDTGGLASPQLHFEVRHKASAGEKAKPIDPLLALPPQPASP